MIRDIQFREPARHDLASIWMYSRDRWGLDQAEAYLDTLEATIKRLSHLPTVGTERGDLTPGLHKLKAGSHHIYYLFDDTKIDVVRILHQRQDAESVFGSQE